jgi:hypothetical protein
MHVCTRAGSPAVWDVQGNMAEAVESYVKALALDPNFVLALFNLGQAHDRLGNVRTCLRASCVLA